MPFSEETNPSGFYNSQNKHNRMNNAERVEFPNIETRNEFFNSPKKHSEAKTWEELYKIFNIDRSMFQYYRYGIHTVPRAKFQNS